MRKSYTKSKLKWYPRIKEKIPFSCIGKEDGYMTVFASLLFILIAGVLFACLEGGLVYQAKARCSMAQTGLGEHLLANYNVPLAKRYHLYFLDPRMNKLVLEEKAMDYYEELFYSSSNVGLFSSPLWNLETDYMEVDAFGTMQEKECEYFITQIEDDMKYDLTKDLVLKALGNATQETEKHNAQIDETVKKLDGSEPDQLKDSPNSDDHTLTPSEVAEGEQAGQTVQDNNPLKKIRSILEHGILGIVADENSLSERSVTPSLLPFKNQNENKIQLSMDILKNLDNIKEQISGQEINQLTQGLKSQGAVNCYIQKHFNCYGKNPVIKDTWFLYEIEYILGGQNSDKENLEYVVNRLVLLRFALNAAYAFGDDELNSQAMSMAALLTGITGTPEFMEAVKYIILAAVNLIESVTDVEALLGGEKVPFLKTTSSWKTSINGAVNDKKNTGEELGYEEYLFILLALQSDQYNKCLRMQNLMQLNIQREEPAFQIKECRAGIQIGTGVHVKSLFYKKEYLLENKEKVQY